ncbi:hypothetical protein CcaverHIS641_0403110 [Cutaneotrichosporon cavernicola]|nr:hypothetical protein CcaverHIS641_0403110 [Cutaneotrichosporon cavernicola]
MSANKVIIFGVTGVQGASVARALLTNPKFSVWGVTRNPASKSSQEMEKLGVNLIKGDLGDASSYADALKGAAGVFLNVNCEVPFGRADSVWAHYKGNNADEARDIEMAQSNAAVDACKAAGVGLVVYSALESVGKFPIPHFDAKAEVVKYIKAQGVPATILYSSYYFTNLLSAKLEERGDEIVLKLPLPDDTVIPAFNPNQIGLFARLAFENPQEWTGKFYSDRKYVTMGVSRDDFLALPGEMDQELWLNYRAFVDGLMSRNPEESRKLVPEVQDFTTWVKADKDAVAKFGLRS